MKVLKPVAPTISRRARPKVTGADFPVAVEFYKNEQLEVIEVPRHQTYVVPESVDEFIVKLTGEQRDKDDPFARLSEGEVDRLAEVVSMMGALYWDEQSEAAVVGLMSADEQAAYEQIKQNHLTPRQHGGDYEQDSNAQPNGKPDGSDRETESGSREQEGSHDRRTIQFESDVHERNDAGDQSSQASDEAVNEQDGAITPDSDQVAGEQKPDA